MINLITKDFLKLPNSIRAFFISSIGPKIKKAETEPRVNCDKNVLAIKASASEHKDKIKA